MSHDNVAIASGSLSNIQLYSNNSASTILSSKPPPLITFNTSSFQPAINNPFFVKVLAGNICVCQGCRGSLRLTDGSVPSPPFDQVIARMEKRSYRDAAGVLKTPTRLSASHYHLKITCVRGIKPNFIPAAENFQTLNDILSLLTFQHC